MKIKIISDDGSIKGGYINLLITFLYLIFIITGMFFDSVADRIVKLSSFLTWFFGISFTVWSAKNAIESIIGDNTVTLIPPVVPSDPVQPEETTLTPPQ